VLLFGLWTVRAGVPSDVFGRRVTSVPVAVVVATAMAQTLPLAWRRKAPLAVFWVVLAACLVQVSLRLALRTDISLMIALYGLVRYAPVLRRSVLMLAGAGTLTAVVLAVFRVPHLRHNTPFVLFFLCCAAAASAGLGLAGRARQAQLVAMSERADRLETERDQRTRIATATERARVSREMHDIVGHNLAVIIGLADGGAALAPVNQERAAEALRLIAATGRQALSELRFTLGALREHQPGTGGGPDLRPQPGAADLPALLDRTRAAGPQVTYTTSGNLAALTPGLQLTIYRIAQESLTNVLRHAGTDTTVQVTLHVSTSASQVRIAVEDTGPPGQPAGQRARTDEERDGQGLTGIRERANLLGGTAQAGPRPGGGWAVHVVLPMLPVPAVSSAPTTPADREQP
jgi:signal transduction histidine kinase